jgi:hypothetical protein
VSVAEQISSEATNWLDGPGLVHWLESHGLDNPEIQLGFHARAIRHWRAGCKASVYVADRVLIKLGLHLSEIPDDLWVQPPKRGELSPDHQAEIVRRVCGLGRSISAVARELDCDQKTVRKYLKEAGAC